MISFDDRSKVVFILWIILLFLFQVYLCYADLSVPCNLVITCWERAELLALLCVGVFLVFLSFSVWCSGSSVVLDCIDSWSHGYKT